MTDHEPPTRQWDPQGGLRATSGLGVASSGFFAAAVGFVALLLGARYLTIDANARFNVFWSALFLVFGILSGLAVETTRSIASQEALAEDRPAPGKTVTAQRLGLVAMLIVLVLVGATLPMWRSAVPTMTGHDGLLLCVALWLGILGYTGQSVAWGALAGAGEWKFYALVTFTESAVRLVLVAVTAVAGWGVVGLAFATIIAEYAWLVIVVLSKTVRRSLTKRGDVPVALLTRRILLAMVGFGASTVLLVGFPWLIGLTTADSVILGAAPLMLAISLTRAPLVVPIYAFYNVAISYLTRSNRSRLRALPFMLGAVFVVGVLGGALAWAVGPWLLGLVGPDYVLPGRTLAGLTFGAACLAAVMITGILCQSSARYGHYLVGWLVAVGIAVATLLSGLSLATRVILALVIAPLGGMMLHVFFIMRQSRHDAG